TATLPQVPTVQNILLVTPPQPNALSQDLLPPSYITQLNQLFQLPPPQTIPPFTYPTQTIPKLHNILPPANQFLPYPKKY
uniref:histidinol dehydrogenase n=1 Tax=Staphylococcus aureus TaxID=1280 RepID=UPI0016434B59